MPDLQSELKKLETLSFDDSGETQQEPIMFFEIKNNASRKTFNFVRDNPKTTRQNAIQSLAAQGILKSTSASLIGQFLRQGMMKSEKKLLTVTQPEYSPLKARPKKTEVANVTDKKIEIVTIKNNPVVTQDTSVRAMLAQMSIIKAREMYDELKRIFGG